MTDDRKILLGMPSHGRQTAGAGRGFWRACRDMREVNNWQAIGSLLCSNFNQLWCVGLNLVHGGERLDYFAMLHDDIGPEEFWLDTLIDEMEAENLDVTGVGDTIKDHRGLTSMALQPEYGDGWMPLARLTMHDVYQLPQTFTAADVGHPLLLNSGCWVCRWNQEWCNKVHFEIRDRIVFNDAAGRYQ